jgi:hypothetical protein
LLDEFDAHLNPQMSKMFIEIVNDILIQAFDIQVIMTTHSPSTVAYIPEENLFWMEDGKVFWIYDQKKPKRDIIEALTPGILTFNQDKLLLLSNKNYIIFTEGGTDAEYIKLACEKLDYKSILNECDFIPADGDKGKEWLNVFNSKKSLKNIIAIFDYDKVGINAFIDFSKENKDKIGNDGLNHYCINKCHALLLPLNKTDYINESKYGYHPIEFLFKNTVLNDFSNTSLVNDESQNHIDSICFREVPRSTTIRKLTFNQDKKGEFCEHVKQNHIQIDFANFKPLLDKIHSILNNQALAK